MAQDRRPSYRYQSPAAHSQSQPGHTHRYSGFADLENQRRHADPPSSSPEGVTGAGIAIARRPHVAVGDRSGQPHGEGDRADQEGDYGVEADESRRGHPPASSVDPCAALQLTNTERAMFGLYRFDTPETKSSRPGFAIDFDGAQSNATGYQNGGPEEPLPTAFRRS